jgi:hypothetical protein
VTPKVRIEAEAAEIGAGGMSVCCESILDVSQPVELQFCLPPEGPEIRIAAIVWWKKEGSVGFRFDLLSPQRATIAHWIEARIQTARYSSKPL